MKTRHRLGLTMGLTAGLSGIVPLGGEQTYYSYSPQQSVAVAEQGFTQNVTQLAGAVIGLCNSAPQDEHRRAAALSCDIPLPGGGHFQAAITEARAGSVDAAAAQEVSFGSYGVPLSPNQNFGYHPETDNGQWVAHEGAQGYPDGLTILSPLGSAQQAESWAAWRGMYDDAVETLAEVKASLGASASSVKLPSEHVGPNVCGEPSVCS